MQQQLKSIKIRATTLEELKKMALAGQSIDGVIRELIEFAKKKAES